MPRAHLYRPLQGPGGNIPSEVLVRVLEPGTNNALEAPLYPTRDSETPMLNPFQATNGVIEFYLDRPAVVRIEAVVAGQTTYFEDVPVGFPRKETFSFAHTGDLEISFGLLRHYVEEDCYVESIRASVGAPSEGDSVIVDVNRNGTTIFPDQAERPTILEGENTDLVVPTGLDLEAGDYLTVDVDQVGSTTPGGRLTVQVRVGYS